jgi:hypothetical protein
MGSLLKIALLGGVSAVAALFVRRRQRRRLAASDVGTVSEEWLAQRRGIDDALP